MEILRSPFKGWQTSQSFRMHCFQWAIICRDDAQWETLQARPSEQPLRCSSTFFIISRVGDFFTHALNNARFWAILRCRTVHFIFGSFLMAFAHLAWCKSKISCCLINLLVSFGSLWLLFLFNNFWCAVSPLKRDNFF